MAASDYVCANSLQRTDDSLGPTETDPGKNKAKQELVYDRSSSTTGARLWRGYIGLAEARFAPQEGKQINGQIFLRMPERLRSASKEEQIEGTRQKSQWIVTQRLLSHLQ